MLNKERERMVATQIEARGITDPLVLDAMRAVPRESARAANETLRAIKDDAINGAAGIVP